VRPTFSIFELEDRALYVRHKAWSKVFKKVGNTLFHYNADTDKWEVNCNVRVNAKFVHWNVEERIKGIAKRERYKK